MRGGDPDRGADRVRGRRLPRDGLRSALPQGHARGRGPAAAAGRRRQPVRPRRGQRVPARAGPPGVGVCCQRVSDEIPYRIRRSSRARRVHVSVDAEAGVEVVLPPRAREREAAEAMRELGPWVRRRLARLDAARAELGLVPGTTPYLDERLGLVSESGRQRVTRRGDALLVPGGDPRPALERWYRRRAGVEVAARLDAACAGAGVDYERLTIRGQRTRWASCAGSGSMSF